MGFVTMDIIKFVSWIYNYTKFTKVRNLLLLLGLCDVSCGDDGGVVGGNVGFRCIWVSSSKTFLMIGLLSICVLEF